jgi:hypothetical protein
VRGAGGRLAHASGAGDPHRRRSGLWRWRCVYVTFIAKVRDLLPEWPPGTVTILATAGEPPHVIPVSAAVRAGPQRALVALASTRDSLARVRADPRVSLAIVCEDVAVTAYGRARVLDAEAVAHGVVTVEIDVEHVQDHDRPTFAIESGVRWRWTDPDAERRDAEVRAALVRLAGLAGSSGRASNF